ncbi:MAG TPA: PQQ-binding-like beta-propeller repeat protein [Polyangiales bacterium]|jgi:outer membrane protein assembly factor BamB|nr:PQQ-binding-like beta-propeller repeat protein [Polyangiales bacterium]
MNNTTWSGKSVLVACNERGPSTLFALDPATGDIVWQRKLKGSVWGRISVANGVGFVGNEDMLEAFDIETGAVIANYASPHGTLASVITIANGHVAFGDGLEWVNAKGGNTLTVLRLP